MEIYIVRHGETELNVKGVLQGWIDEPLNASGRELAAITGHHLKGIRFDCCITSPLVRAKETAEIILQESGNDSPIFTDERIREINCGDYEGKPLMIMGKEGQRFYDDPFHFIGFPNGETIRDVCERTQNFLKEIIRRDDGKIYLISTHGTALRAMLNFLYDDPSDFWHGHIPYNCVVSIVTAMNGEARLTADDVIYYPRELIVDRYFMKEKTSDS